LLKVSRRFIRKGGGGETGAKQSLRNQKTPYQQTNKRVNAKNSEKKKEVKVEKTTPKGKRGRLVTREVMGRL